jgi:hypothetical protein
VLYGSLEKAKGEQRRANSEGRRTPRWARGRRSESCWRALALALWPSSSRAAVRGRLGERPKLRSGLAPRAHEMLLGHTGYAFGDGERRVVDMRRMMREAQREAVGVLDGGSACAVGDAGPEAQEAEDSWVAGWGGRWFTRP